MTWKRPASGEVSDTSPLDPSGAGREKAGAEAKAGVYGEGNLLLATQEAEPAAEGRQGKQEWQDYRFSPREWWLLEFLLRSRIFSAEGPLGARALVGAGEAASNLRLR